MGSALKAHTHTPILARWGLESVVEPANCTIDSVIVGQLSVSNMFIIQNPLESADGNRPMVNWPSGYGP